MLALPGALVSTRAVSVRGLFRLSSGEREEISFAADDLRGEGDVRTGVQMMVDS